MKAARLSYLSAESLDEAIEARSRFVDTAAVLAGGQSLVPLLNQRGLRPKVLIDLGRIDELSGIRPSADVIAIGAMTTQADVCRCELIAEKLPLLAEALPLVGHPAIRNRGTIGGSLALADPAAEIPAVAVALDAELVVRSSSGTRTVPASAFFRGQMESALEPDELLIEVRFPVLPNSVTARFVEISRRYNDPPVAGAGVLAVRAENGAISDVRIVMIGVASTPFRAYEAESLLCDVVSPDHSVLDEVARAATSALEPPALLHSSSAYRRRVAAVVLRRALKEVFA